MNMVQAPGRGHPRALPARVGHDERAADAIIISVIMSNANIIIITISTIHY